MTTANDNRWIANYNELRKYIYAYGHLPDKKKVNNRRLLNWWKYNKKLIKQGKLGEERLRLMQELSNMRQPSNKPQEQLITLCQ